MVVKKLIGLTLLGFTEAGQCFTSDSEWTKVGLTNPKFGFWGSGEIRKPSKPWFNHPYQTFMPGNAVDGNLETYAMGTNVSPKINHQQWNDYPDSRFTVNFKRKCIPREVVIYPRQCGGYEQYETMTVTTGMQVRCYPEQKYDAAFVQNNLHTGLIYKCSNKTGGFKLPKQPPADTDFVVVSMPCDSWKFYTEGILVRGICDYKIQIAEIEVFCE